MANDLIPKVSSSPTLSASRIVYDIRDHFQVVGDEDGGQSEQEWACCQALTLKVESWCEWFTESHAPGAEPEKLAQAKQWDVDFRILLLAFPVVGARLLYLAEACYEIDKAICGLGHITSQKAEELKAMDVITYLASEDPISLWKIGLCELEEDIRKDDGNRLANFIRVEDIQTAVYEFDHSYNMDFWMYVADEMSEHGWYDPYTLRKRIDTRNSLLDLSLKTLNEAVDAAKKRGPRNQRETTIPDKVQASTGFQDQARLNESVRKRKSRPTTSKEESTTDDTEAIQNRPDTGDSLPASLQTFEVDSPSANRGRYTNYFTSRLEIIWQRVINLYTPSNRHLVPRNILEFMIHKSTALVLILVSVATSVGLIVISAFKTQPLDSNFYSSCSQAVLSIISVYLTTLPPLRSRSLRLRYRLWFWLCSLFSVLASVISIGVYPNQPTVSLLLGYGASFAQIIVTVLLVECVEKAVKDGSIGGAELD